MMRARFTLLASLMMLIATFAMTATGFAHRFSDDRSSPELLAYLSMGGTLAEICGETDPAHHLSTTCDACLITQNVLLQEVVNSAPIPAAIECSAPFASARDLLRPARPDTAHPSRAPPARVIA